MSEKHKLRIKYLIKLIAFVTPSILGTIGYLIEGLSISESLYYSVGLYVLNFYGDECNAMLEIARWMAPVVTISGIFFVVKSVTQSSILTEKNIMSEELYRIGMELNYSYNEHFSKETHEMRQKDIAMREMWDNLDGFTKASNIASADYHEIRFMILKRQGKEYHNFTEEEREWLSKAEHIRWCRFHFLNHWTYGTLEDGKRKDVNKRIHTYLVPYEELPREVQMLDWDTISRLMKLKS